MQHHAFYTVCLYSYMYVLSVHSYICTRQWLHVCVVRVFPWHYMHASIDEEVHVSELTCALEAQT